VEYAQVLSHNVQEEGPPPNFKFLNAVTDPQVDLFAPVWYRVWSHDNRCTINVQGQGIEGQGHSKICKIINKSSADCSISLKFGTVFDYVLISDELQTFKVKWSKVKVTAWKRRLIAKLLLSVWKSESLDLIAMSEFWPKAGSGSLCACAVYTVFKKTGPLQKVGIFS